MKVTILKLICFSLLFSIIYEASADSSKRKKRKSKKTHQTRKLPVQAPPPKHFDFSALSDTANPIIQIFRDDSNFYNEILSRGDQARLQIIYTRIDRDSMNHPGFTSYKYQVNPYNYFYPASCVKLPLTALTLEKLNELKIPGVNKETPLTVDSVNACQYATITDSSASNYRASLGHYIKKILLVSDNDAYNRLFEFNGTERIHKRLADIGLPDVRITHRFFTCDTLANKCTNRFNFLDPAGNVFYKQESMFDSCCYSRPIGPITVGNTYMDFDGKLKPYPKNFTDRNYFKLEDIHEVLKRLIFPETYNKNQQFGLTDSDYFFLRKYMSMHATESKEPVYDSAHGYFDCIKKYLIYGQKKDTTIDTNIRIFNIVGFSYGFLVDCAYIIDFKTNTEFIVSATVYSNQSEILNWNKYEYYTLGMPFLKKFGRDCLIKEQQRIKKVQPDLRAFRFNYRD